MPGRPKVVSLYTGAGGLDLGFEAAGFDTAVAVEYDSTACDTLRQNRDWPVIEADIHSPEASSKAIMDTAGLRPGEADVLIGGPPCQPFSKSAFWASGDTKGLDDPRADTLSAYLRVLRDLQPKAFLLENVSGITTKKKSEALKLLQGTIDSINREVGTDYSFNWRILNTADYGVPQTRQRFFLVGARDGTEFSFPAPTHGDNSNPDLFDSVEPWLTAWDAIGDLEGLEEDLDDLKPTGKWASLLPAIPEGENYLFLTPRGDGMPLFGWRTRFWAFLLKLSKSRPSWTITAQPGSATGPFHWRSRRLTMRELCRLQTFPDTYVVTGGRTEVQRQLGNAVPSLMGEVLGRELYRQVISSSTGEPNGSGAYADLPTLLPLRRGAPPPPESPLPVPQKYHHLIGDHAEHPGAGKGPLHTGGTTPTTSDDNMASDTPSLDTPASIPTAETPTPSLETLTGMEIEEIAEMIVGNSRAYQAVKGGCAEHHLEARLSELKNDGYIFSYRRGLRDDEKDFYIRLSEDDAEEFVLECKNADRVEISNMDDQISFLEWLLDKKYLAFEDVNKEFGKIILDRKNKVDSLDFGSKSSFETSFGKVDDKAVIKIVYDALDPSIRSASFYLTKCGLFDSLRDDNGNPLHLTDRGEIENDEGETQSKRLFSKVYDEAVKNGEWEHPFCDIAITSTGKISSSPETKKAYVIWAVENQHVDLDTLSSGIDSHRSGLNSERSTNIDTREELVSTLRDQVNELALDPLYKALPEEIKSSGYVVYEYSTYLYEKKLAGIGEDPTFEQKIGCFDQPIGVDFQRTRNDKKDTGTRYYATDELDAVAICLFNRNLEWKDFIFGYGFTLHRNSEGKYSDTLKVDLSSGKWFESLVDCIREVRSDAS